MKIIRTVTEERVTEGRVDKTPKWKIGDKVRVWAGSHEDRHGTIEDVRYRDEYCWGTGPHFEYLCLGQWENEGNLVAEGDRRGWHYDRQGYCDNPGRGY